MSSAVIAESAGGVLAAWESYEQVYYAAIDPGRPGIGQPISAPGPAGGRKHPAVARNARRETILAWVEGAGWQKGGALAWQVFDREGRLTTEKGRVPDGIPVWSFATVVAGPGDGFTIVH